MNRSINQLNNSLNIMLSISFTTYHKCIWREIFNCFPINSMFPKNMCISMQSDDSQPLDNVSNCPACDWLPQITQQQTSRSQIDDNKQRSILFNETFSINHK